MKSTIFICVSILIILSLTPCLQAKSRYYGHTINKAMTSADIDDNSSLSPAELENKLKPFLEQKIKNMRGEIYNGRASRPTDKDLFALTRMWNRLTPDFIALYEEATSASAANLDKSYISPKGNFKIYYTTTGADSINIVDTIGFGISGNPATWRNRNSTPNGIPDCIDEAAFALDSAWSMLIDRFGFTKPINAPGPDGSSSQYNVLMVKMEDYGATIPQRRQSASAPGFSSYIEINGDWSANYWGAYNKRPYDAVRVTCAHEFFHSIQYAMAWTNSIDFLPYAWLEGSAVLMEEIAFPDINDYLQYLDTFFKTPTFSFLNDNVRVIELYTNAILFKYLYEKINTIDSIGFVKSVHNNSYAERLLSFHKNIERVSQDHAQKSWAELLNNFHVESYFTGSRAHRPQLFVSDAELMNAWVAPTTAAITSQSRTLNPYSAEFILYKPQLNHSDTLMLYISGDKDASSVVSKTWGASALVTESNGNVEIVTVDMNQNEYGILTLPKWKEKISCLLVVTNASPSSSRKTVTVRTDGFKQEDTAQTIQPPIPLGVAPNVVKLRTKKPIRIYGSNITEVKIITQEGKILDYYNNGKNNANFMFADDTVKWYPDTYKRRIIPGVYFISAVSSNPITNKKNVLNRKFMILP